MHGVRVDEENGEDGCWQTVTRALVVAAIMATEKSKVINAQGRHSPDHFSSIEPIGNTLSWQRVTS